MISSFLYSSETYKSPNNPLGPPPSSFMWGAYIAFVLLFILFFVFRDTIAVWRESLKAYLRERLRQYIYVTSVDGNTVSTKDDGFITQFLLAIEEMFLMPEEEFEYHYLGVEDFEPDIQMNATENTENDGMDGMDGMDDRDEDDDDDDDVEDDDDDDDDDEDDNEDDDDDKDE